PPISDSYWTLVVAFNGSARAPFRQGTPHAGQNHRRGGAAAVRKGGGPGSVRGFVYFGLRVRATSGNDEAPGTRVPSDMYRTWQLLQFPNDRATPCFGGTHRDPNTVPSGKGSTPACATVSRLP